MTGGVRQWHFDGLQSCEAALAKDQFGENITELTSEIAADNDAIFAVNGDYYGFRDTGIVIRNGVAYRDEGARQGHRAGIAYCKKIC